ncbi:ureidoglycolate lyase [Loktanella sp. SALINAS62]|uniref:ureidoglycolate lyase n=1 Tax=Loktanella sp. SALINAS62 TaxID=2706124 RepID=UPI001B8C8430|nr:ureidoglycolate lyase [Loktanella sp. SALINAS62]MBS1300738.1 ureidoglycolate lyase [Loktanella sp. SALINAS62]
MNNIIHPMPLNAADFAPFGDVLDTHGAPDKIINAGLCGRYHDRAALDFNDGRAGISLFDAQPRALPYDFDLVERHPDGSQAFLPMHQNPWLVIVARDRNGAPGDPLAFLVAPGQGVNFHRGTWHGVLTPLHAPGLFAVIDRIGDGPNLQEFRYPTAWQVAQPQV